MQSNLRAIYKAIETITVIHKDAIVPCRGLDNLDPKVNRGNLPIRLLLPVGSNGNVVLLDAANVHRKAVWTIQELSLLGNFTEGQGLEEFASELVDYTIAYIEALKEHATNPAFVINTKSIETGGYEWPVRSGKWYFGALTTLTATEHF